MRRAYLFLLLIAPGVSAQVTLEPGARVRLMRAEADEPRRVGAVVSVGNDSVGVSFEPVFRRALAPTVLQLPKSRLELLSATRRRTGPGMLIGAPILAIAGFYWGSNGFGDFCDGGRFAPSCSKDTSMAMPLFVAGGLTGLGAGAIVGHFIKSETWIPVDRRP
jgi:hypothetical protein